MQQHKKTKFVILQMRVKNLEAHRKANPTKAPKAIRNLWILRLVLYILEISKKINFE